MLFLVLLFYNSDWIGERLYPIKYSETIRFSAGQYQVDPLLIAAIIRVESNYRPELVSKKSGAIGLMQIMPDTAHWIIEQAGLSDDAKHHIHREDINIHLGTWYVRALHKQFQKFIEDRPLEDAIAVIAAAYNAGPGRVNKWIEDGTWDGTAGQASNIPYGETRHYIRRVLYYYKKYTDIYTEKWNEVSMASEDAMPGTIAH